MNSNLSYLVGIKENFISNLCTCISGFDRKGFKRKWYCIDYAFEWIDYMTCIDGDVSITSITPLTCIDNYLSQRIKKCYILISLDSYSFL